MESVAVISAQSVDGRNPDVSTAVASDIPDKIVSQAIFDINGPKVITGSETYGRCYHHHKKNYRTQYFHILSSILGFLVDGFCKSK